MLRLNAIRAFLVERAATALPHGVAESWGTATKRVRVELRGDRRPIEIEKDHEVMIEVVNLVATIERLVAGLAFLATYRTYGALQVGQCHPSTSDDAEGNDIVLVTGRGETAVRLEACDLVSEARDGNGKEASLLSKLGCTDEVPASGVGLFIATSPEFARYLSGRKRRWASKHYSYTVHDANDTADSRVLEVRGRNG